MVRIRFIVLLSLILLILPVHAQQEVNRATHTVQAGENLFRIALRYGVDLNTLAQSNSIADPATIYVGQVLSIPGVSAPDSGDTIENPLVASSPIIHVVERGEYLKLIADMYGVSVQQILQANQILNSTIYPGQRLQIWASTNQQEVEIAEATPEPTAIVEATPEAEATQSVETTPEAEATETAEAAPESTEVATEPIVHTVAPGEYLTRIANRYGVAWESIAEANNITNINQIYVGMQLVIPGTEQYVSNIDVSVPRITENLPDPGAHWGEGKEIVVDLSTQMTYAYEDGDLVFSALVSTGLPVTPTVQGEYAIYHRLEAQTMSGPGYYLPNVQWVQYFYSGYGFHGTYWHENFGEPMSHGCVNLTNEDAEWLYNFGDIGTNVYVQY